LKDSAVPIYEALITDTAAETRTAARITAPTVGLAFCPQM